MKLKLEKVISEVETARREVDLEISTHPDKAPHIDSMLHQRISERLPQIEQKLDDLGPKSIVLHAALENERLNVAILELVNRLIVLQVRALVDIARNGHVYEDDRDVSLIVSSKGETYYPMWLLWIEVADDAACESWLNHRLASFIVSNVIPPAAATLVRDDDSNGVGFKVSIPLFDEAS